jgi:hypothetical protein
MAYSIKAEGMEEISQLLSKLADAAPGAAAQALYEGARVMDEAITKEMRGIKTAPFKYAKDGEERLPSPEEKQALLDIGIGIARFNKNGTEVDTSVGINQAGYADVNWNHMDSRARTNYKAREFKGHENMTTSTLKAAGQYERGLQNRKPIGAIANGINSGTSFMKKQPFFRNGVRKGQQKAMAAMKARVEAAFNAITKENGG